MDELKISTTFTRGLIKKIVNKIVKKKLGVEIGVDISDLHITVPTAADGDKVHLHAVVDIDISKKDLHDLIMKNI